MQPLVKTAVIFCCTIGLVACGSMSTSTTPPPTQVTVTLSESQPRSVDQAQSINLTASVQNDPAGSGVKWSLTCANGGSCGSLSSQSASSVTYTAPVAVTANIAGALTATSVANTGVSSSLMVTAVPLPSIPVGPGSANGAGPPAGAQGTPYSYTLQSSGGVAPYNWRITAGSLPPGMAISAATGVIAGTPTAGGTFNATVTVADSGSPAVTASVPLSFSIAPLGPPAGPISITTISLSVATQNTFYSASLMATGGSGTYQWSLATGTLPADMNLSSSGVLSGTPPAAGSFPFTVAVQDTATPPNSASASFTLTVNPPGPLTITTTSLADAAMGLPYKMQLTSSGGTPFPTWGLATGSSLPANLTLSTDGLLIGMPTVSGVYNFTVQLVEEGTPPPATATRTLSLTIAPLAGANNSLLNGHYAFFEYGGADGRTCGTPDSEGASLLGNFTADGAGNITQGEYDSYMCGTPVAAHMFTGTYSVGADHRGKLVLAGATDGPSTFAFSVADIQSGVAQQAQFIEFDDTGGPKAILASGVMQIQDPASFATSSLTGNYAYGLIGFDGAAGLLVLDGAGGITGPSVTGTYGTPDPSSGRVSVTLNGNAYVAYIINAQQAYLATAGRSLSLSQIQVGEMHLQQSATFTNASLNGPFVAYGTSAASPMLFSLTADGVGNLTGTRDLGTGGVPFSTTYSVSSNGLVVLGTGDVLWLYGPNAGFSTNNSRSVTAMLVYESATGGPYTFDPTSGIYSIVGFPMYEAALYSAEINGTYVYDNSANATATLDFSTGNPNSYPATSTATVPVSGLPYCGTGCAMSTPVPVSDSRAISIQTLGGAFNSQSIFILQK